MQQNYISKITDIADLTIPSDHLKEIKVGDTNVKDAALSSSYYISKTSSLTSQLDFMRAIHHTKASANLPTSSTFTYGSVFSSSATGSITALYELLRGYLYRDDTSPGVSSITSIINSKTSNTPLTGFRVITLNRNIKKDYIKPGTLKISVAAQNITVAATSHSFSFSNSGITTQTQSAGKYAVINQNRSLSGALSAGVSGSTLTGFTIRFKIKPQYGGPQYAQFIMNRRVADLSSTSLGWNYNYYYSNNYDGWDNTVVLARYGSLNPLSAVTNVTYLAFDAFSVSSVFTLSNSGGGTLHWSCSADGNWLSLCSHVNGIMQKCVPGIRTPLSGSITSISYKSTGTIQPITAQYIGYGASYPIDYCNAYIYSMSGTYEPALNFPLIIQGIVSP